MPFSKLIPSLFVCLLALAFASSAQAYSPFQLGIYDPVAASGMQPDAGINFARMKDSNATLTRINIEWRSIVTNSPTKPAGMDARNPADGNYNWSGLDAFVRSAAANGLEPIITTSAAPDWAEGNSASDHAKRQGDPGTYNPNPRDYADLGTALATRYSGKFPDPSNPGQNLPKVRYYQAWNEPNFGQYLSSTSQKKIPVQYVKMLNAYYDAVKKVSGSNLIIAAGLGPYGNNGHATDVEPQFFMRQIFCLTGSSGKHLGTVKRCKVPTPKLDIWSQHPYTFGGKPTTRGASADSAAMGNMPDIARTLKFAVKTKHVLPRGNKRLWSTEMAWFSNPPGILAGDGRQLGVPPSRQAAYLSETAYRLWRTGFSAMVWYGLTDVPDFPSGLYLGTGQGATPKPAFDAFKFPFFADTSGSKTLFWGVAAGAGKVKVRIEKKSGSKYKKVGDIRSDSQGMIYRRLNTGKGSYRATVLSGGRKGLASVTYKAR
jgi:hypothetical protein